MHLLFLQIKKHARMYHMQFFSDKASLCFKWYREKKHRRKTLIKQLQKEVIFTIIPVRACHFGYRGREWIRELMKASVIILSDSNRKNCRCSKAICRKNAKSSLTTKRYTSTKMITMFETSAGNGFLAHCGWNAFGIVAKRLFISKITREIYKRAMV